MTTMYRVESEDRNGMLNDEFQSYFHQLHVSLSNLKDKNSKSDISKEGRVHDNYFYKVIVSNGEGFLVSDEPKISLSGIKLTEVDTTPFKLISSLDDIYSKPLFEKDVVKINGRFYRFIYLHLPPSGFGFNELLYPKGDNTIQLRGVETFPFYIFRKYPKDSAIKNLETIKRPHVANPEDEYSGKAINEIEKLKADIVDGQECMCDFQFWYILSADNIDALNSRTDEIIRFIQLFQGVSLIETTGMKTVLKMLLDNDYCSFLKPWKIQGEYVVMNFPILSEKLYEDGIGFSSPSGKELFFEQFHPSNLNYNMTVDGTSGTGKSFLVNYICHCHVLSGVKVIIMDMGYSFNKLVRYLNGHEFEEKFNPLQFRNPHYLKSFVFSFVPKEEQNKQLGGLVFEIVEKWILDERNTSFKELINEIENQVKGFKYYFSEIWDHITDDIVELNGLTYVNRSKYPPVMSDALTIFMMEIVEKSEGKKVLVVDEAFEAFKNIPDYLEKKARTFRKESGALIPIVQANKDLEKQKKEDRYVGEIINDVCFHHIHFYQPDCSKMPSEIGSKVQALKTEKGQCSRFVYQNPHTHRVMEFWSTYLQHEIYTSEERDVVPMNKFINKYSEYFSYQECIEKWTDFKYLLRSEQIQ